jgi:5-formyltetrahydrofolate cyclo-ligase
MAAPHSFPDLVTAKRTARERALAARADGDPAERAAACAAAGEALAAHVLRDCPPPAGAVVAGVWPLGGEIDLRPLMEALHASGHPVVLPVTPPRGQALTFRLWRPGDALVRERFGTMIPARGPVGQPIRHPVEDSEGTSADGETAPDFLLVPLLAFDRRGHRLGYGAGYYDRTLAALRLKGAGRFALGCAFAAQEIDAVPVGPNDVALDAVATERGVIRCKVT